MLEPMRKSMGEREKENKSGKEENRDIKREESYIEVEGQIFGPRVTSTRV